jgi:hypothetical protein
MGTPSSTSSIEAGMAVLPKGRPAGYRSCSVLRSSVFSVEKGVRGSEKRMMVCLPCLKRRVQLVGLMAVSFA